MSSGLELYQTAIVEAARRLAEHPRLPAPAGSATVDNPLCGDRVTTDVELRAGALVRVGQRVRGCLLCERDAGHAGRRQIRLGQHLQGPQFSQPAGAQALLTITGIGPYQGRHIGRE